MIYGKDSQQSIIDRMGFVGIVAKRGKITEVVGLAKEIFLDAYRVLGVQHQLTGSAYNYVRSHLEEVPVDYEVRFMINKEITEGRLVRHSASGKYIIEFFSKHGEKKRVKANLNEIVVGVDTPVSCQGLIGATHLNGKTGIIKAYDSSKKRYEVAFNDIIAENCLVRPDNLKIVLDWWSGPIQTFEREFSEGNSGSE